MLLAAGVLLAGCAHLVKPPPAVPRHPVPPTPAPAVPADYTARAEVQAFIAKLVQQHGFERAWLEKTLGAAQKNDNILAAIAKPYEAKPWYQYQPLFVNNSHIKAGVEFWNAHAALLDQVQTQYGVPPAIVVAILGVESFYGRQKGGYSVLDALSTLAFDYPARASFFQYELEQYLLMCRAGHLDPLSLSGSYAGAMGAPQFMPDSYRRYAVAFDGHDPPDIWNDWADIIGSVANYLHLQGWQPQGLVAVPAAVPLVIANPPATLTPTTVGALRTAGVMTSTGLANDTPAMLVALQLQDGTQYWLGLDNFRAILQYNRSPLYAMAIYDLATRISQARALAGQSAPP
ncbi:MAG TPA: lytic murein transglycosylase B [Gammaproteobacteria bacterium]|nr:lytic murein transglycosylase B [Gammaproteobacteria bacterium]